MLIDTPKSYTSNSRSVLFKMDNLILKTSFVRERFDVYCNYGESSALLTIF